MFIFYITYIIVDYLQNNNKNFTIIGSHSSDQGNRLPNNDNRNVTLRRKFLTTNNDVKMAYNVDNLTKGLETVSLTCKNDSQRLSFMVFIAGSYFMLFILLLPATQPAHSTGPSPAFKSIFFL